MIKIDAHAKINWSLDVVGVREDGYHLLNMLMQTVEYCDELTFTPAKWTTLTANGKLVPMGGKNLILRAIQAINDYAGTRYGVRVTLVKRIPVRAGLGGGSADCAATLHALNALWQLKLPIETLSQIGARLGADVPYCLTGGFCRVTGIGENITEIPGAPRAHVLIVPIAPGLSTQAVFKEWDAQKRSAMNVDIPALSAALKEARYQDAEALSGNCLESVAAQMLPSVAHVIASLKALNARFVRMSGSGSAVFAVFDDEDGIARAKVAHPNAIDTWTLAKPSIDG